MDEQTEQNLKNLQAFIDNPEPSQEEILEVVKALADFVLTLMRGPEVEAE